MSLVALSQLLYHLRAQTEKSRVAENVSRELDWLQNLLIDFENTQSLERELHLIKQELAVVQQTQNQLGMEFEHFIQFILC